MRNKNFDNTKDLLRVVTIEKNSVVDDSRRPLKIEGANIFIRHSQAISILDKVRKISSEFIESWISPRKPFGIESSFSQTENFKEIADKIHNVKCLGKGFTVGYINFSQITAHQDWIEKIKIFMPYANNIGTELSDDNLNTFVDEGKMVCTEAYICVGVGHLENKNSAENLANYLHTRFARFMHSLAKASQHATAKTFCFVPIQNFSKAWTDSELYLKYNLSAEEIKFIESKVKAMD